MKQLESAPQVKLNVRKVTGGVGEVQQISQGK